MRITFTRRNWKQRRRMRQWRSSTLPSPETKTTRWSRPTVLVIWAGIHAGFSSWNIPSCEVAKYFLLNEFVFLFFFKFQGLCAASAEGQQGACVEVNQFRKCSYLHLWVRKWHYSVIEKAACYSRATVSICFCFTRRCQFCVFSDARNMAKDVQLAFCEIAEEQGEMTRSQATDYIKKLMTKGRYSQDVWS